MKIHSSFLFSFLVCSSLVAISPPPLTSSHHYTPIQSLLITSPTQEKVWIQGTIISQEEDDVYLMEEGSCRIRLFLSLDELLQYTLTPGDHIAAWGKIDKNALSPEKNEFYTEKLFLQSPQGGT